MTLRAVLAVELLAACSCVRVSGIRVGQCSSRGGSAAVSAVLCRQDQRKAKKTSTRNETHHAKDSRQLLQLCSPYVKSVRYVTNSLCIGLTETGRWLKRLRTRGTHSPTYQARGKLSGVSSAPYGAD